MSRSRTEVLEGLVSTSKWPRNEAKFLASSHPRPRKTRIKSLVLKMAEKKAEIPRNSSSRPRKGRGKGKNSSPRLVLDLGKILPKGSSSTSSSPDDPSRTSANSIQSPWLNCVFYNITSTAQKFSPTATWGLSPYLAFPNQIRLSPSHLSKGSSGHKQKCTQFLTPFSGTVFHALSHGSPGFALHGSFFNNLLIDWKSSTANQSLWNRWLMELPWRTKCKLPCKRG